MSNYKFKDAKISQEVDGEIIEFKAENILLKFNRGKCEFIANGANITSPEDPFFEGKVTMTATFQCSRFYFYKLGLRLWFISLKYRLSSAIRTIFPR